MNRLTVFGIVIGVVIMIGYAGFVLFGAWIDGRRQALQERGKHPVTTPTGKVEAKEGHESP